MTGHSLANPYNVRIQTDYDVVTLRQHVRQLARSLGMGLREQAKISTALSIIARAQLESSSNTIFTIVVDTQGAQAMLQIACVPASTSESSDLARIEQSSYIAEARLLIGDLTLSQETRRLVLKLCIPISQVASKQ
jgi:hypothetical protein